MKLFLSQKWKIKFQVSLQIWCLFNISDYYGAQVYFLFFAILVFPYDVISCDVINDKNFKAKFEVLLLNSGYAPETK